MRKNIKADCRWNGIGSKKTEFAGEQKRSLYQNYKAFGTKIQCKHCGSDHMRAAIEGLCQSCLQEAEHLFRQQGQISSFKNKSRRQNFK